MSQRLPSAIRHGLNVSIDTAFCATHTVKKYIDPLEPLRNKYEALCGRMSNRFYDEVRFFSKQLLFGKFDNDGPVMESLFPASQEYLTHYLDMIDDLKPNKDPEFIAKVTHHTLNVRVSRIPEPRPFITNLD